MSTKSSSTSLLKPMVEGVELKFSGCWRALELQAYSVLGSPCACCHNARRACVRC